jgi:hypothetical protein
MFGQFAHTSNVPRTLAPVPRCRRVSRSRRSGTLFCAVGARGSTSAHQGNMRSRKAVVGSAFAMRR